MKGGSPAPSAAAGTPREPMPQLIAATAQVQPDQVGSLERALAFAEPLLTGETLETGENTLVHARGVCAILRDLGGSETMQAAAYLVYTCAHLNRPHEVIAKAFGDNLAELAVETTKLMRVQQQARDARASGQQVDDAATQTENVRKMLLAFSRDLRVVMLRLASRLQTLRYYAAAKRPVSPAMAREALQVFAPLANRLGIWQMKWELEDLAFRFLEPETYKEIARLLDEKRTEREHHMEQLRERLEGELRAHSISAAVTGRPKHIYSIVKKMRGKSLPFEQVFDLRALRVIVPSVKDCYAALSWVHSHYSPIEAEFDDYIARPKPNGYQSLHTVVREETGKAIEIQIRTQAMHDHAESGVAAHWAYKEAGAKGYAGVSASSEYDAKIAVLRQLLAWERDLSGARQPGAVRGPHLRADARRRRGRAAPGRDAAGFRLRRAHQPGPPLPRRAHRWRHGAAEHPAAQRPDGGDQHRQGGAPVARLAQPRAGLPDQQPRALQGARLVQRPGHPRHRGARPRAGGKAAAARGQDRAEAR